MKFLNIPSKSGFSVSICGKIRRNATGFIYNPWKDKDGYLRVTGHGNTHIPVHRSVAEVFVENPSPDKFNIVNHINSDVSDNSPENLEWVDASINRQHSDATNNRNVRGKDHSQAKLTEDQVIEICHQLNMGLGPTTIARNLNTTYGSVQNIKRGNAWVHISTGILYKVEDNVNRFTEENRMWIVDRISRGLTAKEINSMAPKFTISLINKVIEECND